jgi:photosystem II stability/assembly factor-like uncharacterized protein
MTMEMSKAFWPRIQTMSMIVLGLFLLCVSMAEGSEAGAGLFDKPAQHSPMASQSLLLGAAWAGSRVVAVGDRGVVLLSDDGGASFRQARQVPVSPLLTSVSFADARNGWAVGHWGTILATRDGGETWQVQRLDNREDRPLFAVHFFDAQRGVAVGLWSLVLTTEDGGLTWTEQALEPMPGGRRADLNLFNLFASQQGVLYATAERGQVLRSDDQGHNWRYLDTGYEGSLWAGSVLSDGALMVGGLRGSLLRSDDGGQHWKRLELGSKSSITTVVSAGDHVLVAGLEGLLAQSSDRGQHFSLGVHAELGSLTAALRGDQRWVLLSRRGVVDVGTLRGGVQ